MDELTLLRSVYSETADPSPTSIAQGEAALRAAIANSAPPSKKSRPVKRWVVVSGAIAATLVIVAALTLSDFVGLAGWRGGADAAAAKVLNRTAEQTIKTADPQVPAGSYLKVTTTTVFLVTTTSIETRHSVVYQMTSSDQLYVPADSARDWVWNRPAATPYRTFGAESEAAANADKGKGELLEAPGGAFYGNPAATSPATLSSMPRDPYRLLNWIYRTTLGQGNSPDDEAFVFIADTLRSGIVPADLRSALFRAAAMIPGVTIGDRSATLDGQSGVAISKTDGGVRHDLILDPETGLLIGEREVALTEGWGVPVGTEIGSSSIKTSVVDSAPSGGTVCGSGCSE